MKSASVKSRRSCVGVQPSHDRHFKSNAPAGTSGTVPHGPMTATDLEAYLVCAINARTNGRAQALKVRVLGNRTVLCGLFESYHAVQLAVAGLMETLDALGLDFPGHVDLDIELIPNHWVRSASTSRLAQENPCAAPPAR